MGVKFVSPKNGDAVAVVARSVEAKEVDEEPVAEAVEEGTVDATVVAGDSSSETADAVAADESTESPNRPNRPGMQQSRANPTRKVTPDVRQFEAGDDR